MCLVLQRDSPFASRKLSRNRHYACGERLGSNGFYIIFSDKLRQTKHDSSAVYYFSDPTNVGCFFAISLPPSADSAKINITSTNGKQDAARRLEATRGKHEFLCYIFRLWVIIKALLKQISLYLPSHFCIRIIVLTCPDNKSARNHQPKSCVPAKSYKSQWCEANIISIEIFAPFQFVVSSCSCEDLRVPPLILY